MSWLHLMRRGILVFPLFLLAACGSKPVGQQDSLRIEPIAAVVNGVAQWDPNIGSTLYLHAIGLPDTELGQVVWSQSGLALENTLSRGAMLALYAGGEGCGYGGVTFSVTASVPGRGVTESISVEMARYICPGSPWAVQ